VTSRLLRLYAELRNTTMHLQNLTRTKHVEIREWAPRQWRVALQSENPKAVVAEGKECRMACSWRSVEKSSKVRSRLLMREMMSTRVGDH